MRRIFITRHGKYDRIKHGLAESGIEKSRLTGSYIASQIDDSGVYVMSSSAPRARATTNEIVGMIGFEDEVDFRDYLWHGGGSPEEGFSHKKLKKFNSFMEELYTLSDSHPALIIVSHEVPCVYIRDYFMDKVGIEKSLGGMLSLAGVFDIDMDEGAVKTVEP